MDRNEHSNLYCKDWVYTDLPLLLVISINSQKRMKKTSSGGWSLTKKNISATNSSFVLTYGDNAHFQHLLDISVLIDFSIYRNK